MDLKIQKTKLVAGTVTVLLVGSLFSTGSYYYKNKNLIGENNDARLRSEKLLSEKLMLDKEINSMKMDISGLRGRNKELDMYLNDLSQKLQQKEATIARLSKENARTNALKKELVSIKKMKEELNMQVMDMSNVISQLRKENDGLTNQLAFLQGENESLNYKLRNATGENANRYKVEALKGKKDKLTVKAGKTDKITISFDMPENAIPVGEKKPVYMVVKAPDGMILPAAKPGKVMLAMEDRNMEIYPSVTKEVMMGTTMKRMIMEYEADKKLAAGVYSIDIYTDSSYLGSAEVRLRK